MTKPKVVQNKNKDGEKAAGWIWTNANLLNLATPQLSHLADSQSYAVCRSTHTCICTFGHLTLHMWAYKGECGFHLAQPT